MAERMSLPQSIFSIDVEDWFNLSGTGFEPRPSEWDRLEGRIERNLQTLLELLAAAGGTATCFVVGYFAERFPHLIREAAAAGHKIASHSYFHRLVYEMSADDTVRKKAHYRNRCDLFLYREEEIQSLLSPTGASFFIESNGRDFFVTVEAKSSS
jgi:peptidoglycan/xylan/chitin deacetylase (PgdA/CDA1 family)